MNIQAVFGRWGKVTLPCQVASVSEIPVSDPREKSLHHLLHG